MCPRKQTTEPKLVILVSFFSVEVTSYTGTSYYIHILWEVCKSYEYFYMYNMQFCFFPFEVPSIKVLDKKKILYNPTKIMSQSFMQCIEYKF